MSSTTITTEVLCSPSSAPAIPTTIYGKLRYVPAGHTPVPSPNIFHLPPISEFSDVRRLPLHDIRPIPSVDQLPSAKGDTAQLCTHGFTAVRHPSAMHSAPYSYRSWKDPKLLEEVYIPETEDMVKRITGAKKVVTEGFILRSAIWAEQDALATLAGYGQKKAEQEDSSKESMDFPQFVGFSSSTGGASPAPKIHLDYAPNGARTHIRKYHPKLTSSASDIIAAEERLLSSGLGLRDHYATSNDCPRWSLFSMWRPLKPVKRDPLALGDARSFAEEDYVPIKVRVPNFGVPGTVEVHEVESYLATASQTHRWCWISNQQPEEVLVIGLFDSQREKAVSAGGTLHSSVDLDGTEHVEPRESIELRCLAIWEA